MTKTWRFTIFVFSSVFASLLNFLTYPLLARVLAGEQFAAVALALAVLTQVSAFLGSLVALSTGLTKQQDRQETGVSPELLQTVLLRLFVVVIIGVVITAPLTLRIIKLPVVYIIPIALMLLLSIPTSIVSGYFNGKGKIVKLGFVALFTALFQFLACIAIAIILKNGTAALVAMGFGQLISLAFIYFIYRKDNLPAISLQKPTKKNGHLVVYAALSAIGVMVINILQSADLFVASAKQLDALQYTDIYVVSRIVFFGGMVLMWPFLSWLDVSSHQKNIQIISRVFSLFIAGGLTAYALMYWFGNQVLVVIVGKNYPEQIYQNMGVASIIYKINYLIIIMFVLYFIVMRSYWAIAISFATLLLFGVSVVLPQNENINQLLHNMNIASGVAAITCLGCYIIAVGTKYSLSAKL